MFKRDGDDWRLPDKNGYTATPGKFTKAYHWGETIGTNSFLFDSLSCILAGSALLKQFLKSDTGHLGNSYFKADDEHSEKYLAAYFIHGFASTGFSDDTWTGSLPLEAYMTFAEDEVNIFTQEGFTDRYQLICHSELIHIINTLCYTAPGVKKAKLIFEREIDILPSSVKNLFSACVVLPHDVSSIIDIVARANHSQRWSNDWETAKRPKRVISITPLDEIFGQPPIKRRKWFN